MNQIQSDDRGPRSGRDQPRFLIDGRVVAGDDPLLQSHLERVHKAGGDKPRPRCLCTEQGAEMYVAKVGGRFLIKRMPGQGGEHDPMCATYEPPAELSGLGQVMGQAITEDPIDGTTSLRLDFALKKVSRRAPAMSETEESDTAKTSGTKLSLRGLLHFLWTEAEFNKWSPGMEGKRNWGTLRKYLLNAAESKHTKGSLLTEALYIPEPWHESRKAEIAARRRAQFLRVATGSKSSRSLMLAIGEVKLMERARYGHRIRLKHAPDVEFLVDDELAKAISKRFENEIGFFQSNSGESDPANGHLVLCGTFSVDMSGRPTFEEVVLMFTNRNWIPVEDLFEVELIEQLMPTYRFTKGLRFNLTRSRPLACAVIADADPQPTALYIVPPGAGEAYGRVLDELVEQSRLASWVWRPADGEMQALPSRSPLSRRYGAGRYASRRVPVARQDSAPAAKAIEPSEAAPMDQGNASADQAPISELPEHDQDGVVIDDDWATCPAPRHEFGEVAP